jgi:hypothetical protein
MELRCKLEHDFYLDCVLLPGRLVDHPPADGEASLAQLLLELVLKGDWVRLNVNGNALKKTSGT